MGSLAGYTAETVSPRGTKRALQETEVGDTDEHVGDTGESAAPVTTGDTAATTGDADSDAAAPGVPEKRPPRKKKKLNVKKFGSGMPEPVFDECRRGALWDHGIRPPSETFPPPTVEVGF